MEYRKGDFVRVGRPDANAINRIRDQHINIFPIDEINEEAVSLNGYSTKLSMTDIEPIPIDGKSDVHIYYDPIVAASFVAPGGSVPDHHRNYTYYYDRFKSCFLEEENFQQLISKEGLRHVHEVQHFLMDKFQDDGLKLDLY